MSVTSSVGFVALRYQFLAFEVIEGETEVVNIRETDSSLTPLVFGLVALGIVAIVGTGIFGWLTRPKGAEQTYG